ncbi:MAG TPA: PilZ domain-containing protein [Allosphingosinicella sp.]|jgi:hypothetical protein|nr:PilZ domain-containing protein [Allosphingosinicella sp.]
MPKGQLAKLPAADGRRTERRVVNLAASLREPGATVVEVDVLNLSVTGFMATSNLPLEMGHHVYLKLPGMEAQKSQVVWVEGDKAGFQFATPLHPATLDQLVSTERKPIPRNHFGPRRTAR